MNRALRRKAKRGLWDRRFLNGHPDVEPKLHKFIMLAVARGLVVTSTTGGVHAPGSFHYTGRAVDLGVRSGLVGTQFAVARLVRFQRFLHTHYGSHLTELFGPSNRANRKWGRAIVLAEGSGLEQLHDNHIHVAI